MHDWAVVNEFGDSKCFVDRNSIDKRGDIARALVMYSLVPPGADKRNNKEVVAMFNVEEYDLRAGAFRVAANSFSVHGRNRKRAIGHGPRMEASDARKSTYA